MRCRCDYVPDSLARLRSAGPYDGWLREAVHRMKYQGESARAAHLAAMLVDHAVAYAEVEAIVPIPIHRARLKERGFNQSALIAEALSKPTGIPVWNALSRVRDTPHQIDLSNDERVVNVRGAFLARGETQIRPARVILLDDVFTSGATMDECARVLLGSGVDRVEGLSVC